MSSQSTATVERITVQMKAVFELRVGGRLNFQPDIPRAGNDPSFCAFAAQYKGQNCKIIGLPSIAAQIAADEAEPDDAEATLFACYAAAEAILPLITVQFADGVEREIRVYHLVALDPHPVQTPLGERDLAGLGLYAEETRGARYDVVTEARKHL